MLKCRSAGIDTHPDFFSRNLHDIHSMASLTTPVLRAESRLIIGARKHQQGLNTFYVFGFFLQL